MTRPSVFVLVGFLMLFLTGCPDEPGFRPRLRQLHSIPVRGVYFDCAG